jgi:polysaccharide export outer membrane protein
MILAIHWIEPLLQCGYSQRMRLKNSTRLSGMHIILYPFWDFRTLKNVMIPLTVSLLCFLSSCGGISPVATTDRLPAEKEFKAEMPKKIQEFASPAKIERITPHETYQYRLGPGDIIGIQVWRRPELSQENIVVSPDGFISVPRIGTINVMHRTQNEVQKMITGRLESLYIKPEVTIRVAEFHNNKAFVLGRVSKPGVINFPGKGTLLEALALAGGLPYQGKETFLTKCAIIRGRETVIWIDLQDLLRNGNMALNASIINNDVIFIPEAEDDLIYVMGEVATPGAVQLKNGMNVLKAVMVAGGMNKNANPEKVFVIRQQDMKGSVIRVDLKKLLEHGDFSQNFALLPNDIVFISPSGMARFNYTLEKLLPALQVLSLGTSTTESFGIMQELRKKLWGQEGFVNGSGE